METQKQFEKDKERASKYEMDVAKRIFNNNKLIEDNTWQLSDVRKITEYQEKDIDFLIMTTDFRNCVLAIEVKIDFTSLPNFFFEIGRATGQPGCMMTTEADEVWYYFVDRDKLYRFSTPKLREYLTKTLNELREIDERKGKQEGILPGELEKLSWYKTATSKTNSIGLAIPIESVIKDLCVIIDDYGVKT